VARASEHPRSCRRWSIVIEIDKERAVEIASDFLSRRGILTLGLYAVHKVKGELRAKYLPHKASDYWQVTFSRSTAVIDRDLGRDEEEMEILTAFAHANDTVTVAVEMDGTAEVI